MNILWFCTDQQRFDTLGCAGNAFVRTPNLDRLAGMGVRFDRAYSQSPVCAPSRASFLTGRYPTTCSVRQNGQDIDPRERLISKILSEHGYACGLSGKLHLSACGKAAGRMTEPRIDDGYDSFEWSHHPGGHDNGNPWPANVYTHWLDTQGVERSGQMEDTLFLFCSDHGENLGDHGMYLKGPYFYENNVRVPLIVAAPGNKLRAGA